MLDTSLVSGMWVPAYVEPIPPKTGNPSNKSTAKMYSLWNINMEFALKKVCTHIFWTQIQRFECLVRVSASLSYHLLQSAETILICTVPVYLNVYYDRIYILEGVLWP